jgi:hypothetical protein
VASTAVGRNVGVAKEASVVAVRVLDCEAGFLLSSQRAWNLLICWNAPYVTPVNGTEVSAVRTGIFNLRGWHALRRALAP